MEQADAIPQAPEEVRDQLGTPHRAMATGVAHEDLRGLEKINHNCIDGVLIMCMHWCTQKRLCFHENKQGVRLAFNKF